MANEPVTTHCQHGLDLRVHPRCWLCEPEARPTVTWPTVVWPTTNTNAAPWCGVCLRYHLRSVGPCVSITYG